MAENEESFRLEADVPRYRLSKTLILQKLPRKRFVIALIMYAFAVLPLNVAAAPAADLVVRNADIRTADYNQPAASAFAVKNGRFIAVGDEKTVQPHIGSSTRTIELRGATVTSGFIDGHTHLASGADLVTGVDLSYIPEKSTWLSMIAERSAELPPGEWLLGGGWDYTLGEGEYPTKEDIDAVVSDRPVFLSDIDGHSAWANSMALELAGITADTEVPPGGEIVLDPATGEPTGILKEGAASIVSGLPALQEDEEERRKSLVASVRYANSLGLTGVHEMAGRDGLYDYLALAECGDLTLRVWFGQFLDSSGDARDTMAQAVSDRRAVRARMAERGLALGIGPLLEFGYIKTIVDGVLSTHTALLVEPYSDRPGWRGKPFRSQAQLEEIVTMANAAGFPLAVHAIGDGGVEMVLDSYENAELPLPLPNRIEHLEVVGPRHVSRLRSLGVAASMQPNHATGTIGKYINERIGSRREKHAYVWKDMLKGNVRLILGSDWPTSPLSPLAQINDAVFRESPFGLGDGTWYPEQSLSFEEALKAYSQAGASVTPWADQVGSITPGKWADFVVLDGKLPQPLDRSIRERSVVATYIGGKMVYPERGNGN